MRVRLAARVERIEGRLRGEGLREGGVRVRFRTYTRLFLPLAVAVLAALPLGGRELIWNVDGLAQYYSFFVYEGSWLREVFSSAFSGGGFQVPLWEWCSGYGTDIPTTFDVFLDPLNLVSAITPPQLSEWVFQLLVVLRLYLAGLAFIVYCEERAEDALGSVAGALLYALGGGALTVVRWSSGLHALILFPLILAGAERVLAGRRPQLFVLSLSALAIISYYFTYMASILLVGYLALRVVRREGAALTPGRFLRWVGVFFGLCVLCFSVAGFVLVPTALQIMGMDRLVEGSTAIPVAYDAGYYLERLGDFLSISEVGSDTYQGFGGVAFLALVALFAQRGREGDLKRVQVALTVCLMLPVVGSFLNVMNYASNRWAWAYALCVSVVVARMTPTLLAPDARVRRLLIASTFAYALVLALPSLRTEANVAGYAALLAALLMLVVAWGDQAHRELLFVAALGTTVAVNGFFFLAASEGGLGAGQVPLGMAWRKLTTDSVDTVALDANDPSWWRYDAGQVSDADGAPTNRIPNNSLVLGLQGIDFYNSVYNDRVDAFHTELALAGSDINFSFVNLQGRSDLMALLGVRYYAYRADGTDAAPYSFAEEVARRAVMGIDYRLLRSGRALPLGVVRDRALTREDYLALTPERREQALLQAVVLDEADIVEGGGARRVGADELAYADVTLPFDVVDAQGVVVEDGRFVVTHGGGSIRLSFEGQAQADGYVYFGGLRFEPLRPSELMSAEDVAALSWYRRADLMMRDLSYEAPSRYELSFASDGSALRAFLRNELPSNHMYGGKDSWLVNLGYAEEAPRELTIAFDQPGAYSFDEMRVGARRRAGDDGGLAGHPGPVLEDLTLGCNALSGSVDMEEAGTLVISEAYTPGWTATVDGAPARLFAANTAFMGLNLEAGRHEVALSYMTPGLLPGCALTAAGIAGIAVCLRLWGRGRRGGKRDS